mgnify:CR=1 FL=1
MDWTKKITLKQMRTLRAIVETGSLAQAANRLGISPPAVTIQLKQVEQDIGVRIIERNQDGVVNVTNVGNEIITLEGKIQAHLDHCSKTINSLKEGNKGFVELGVVSTAQYFSPWIVSKAKTVLPGVEVDILVGNRKEIILALDTGKIDMAITGRPPRNPVVNAEMLGENPHIFIARPDHLLVKKCDNLTNMDSKKIKNLLKNETFLTREFGSGTRILLDRFLNSIGLDNPFNQKQMSSNELVKESVMAGLGIALISASTVQYELREQRLCSIMIPGLPIIRHWFLVNKKNAVISSAASQFKKFVTDNKNTLLPSLKSN